MAAKSPAVIDRPAPLIGQHTREVLEESLGIDIADIRGGFDDGTFWPMTIAKYPYIEEMLA